MKLPSFRRIFKQDYDEKDQPLVETLSSSINIGIENLQNNLNRNVSLKDNVFCIVRDLSVTVNSSGGLVTPISIPVDIKTTIIGITIISAINTTNSGAYPISAPFAGFSQSANVLSINNISGLQANTLYSIRIVAWG
jgi:hypothetical protein